MRGPKNAELLTGKYSNPGYKPKQVFTCLSAKVTSQVLNTHLREHCIYLCLLQSNLHKIQRTCMYVCACVRAHVCLQENNWERTGSRTIHFWLLMSSHTYMCMCANDWHCKLIWGCKKIRHPSSSWHLLSTQFRHFLAPPFFIAGFERVLPVPVA